MTRLIDAEKLKKHYAWWEDDKQKLFDSIVDSQPTVDAVPVVRCKDCKYSHKCGGDMLMRSASGGYIYCPLGADGYCSMGERREE